MPDKGRFVLPISKAKSSLPAFLAGFIMAGSAVIDEIHFKTAIAPPDCPSNLLRAQRAHFRANNYERIDRLSGEFFHADWAA